MLDLSGGCFEKAKQATRDQDSCDATIMRIRCASPSGGSALQKLIYRHWHSFGCRALCLLATYGPDNTVATTRATCHLPPN